ncbi:MAG TPA: hypothetical protein VFK02_27170 [Kofleriaceae bacterium]|nr:hypothetical protein [Kofleriaceae bacterium]
MRGDPMTTARSPAITASAAVTSRARSSMARTASMAVRAVEHGLSSQGQHDRHDEHGLVSRSFIQTRIKLNLLWNPRGRQAGGRGRKGL